MKDADKTREQLITKLVELRRRIAGLEALETERKRAEETLRKSKELFEKTFNSQLDAIFILNTANPPTIIDCNPAALQMFGYTRQEMLGHTTAFLHVDEKTLKKFQELLYPSIEKRGSYHLPKFQMKRQDGTMFPSEHSIILLRDEQGKQVGWVSVVRDITERKQAEEALRESEERYRSLVNLGGAVGEAIVMLQDTEQGDAVQTFVSREWPHITGYSRKELLGMSFFDLLHPKYHEAALKRHKRRMRGEAIPKLFELSIIRKDGTEVPIEVTSAYSTYKGERANVAFIRDITERKETEEELLKNRDLLNETGKMARVGGWEFDIETLRQTWTKEVYLIHELDMDYQPTVEKGINFYAPEAIPIISEAVQRTIDYGEPFDVELPFITAKGNRRWVHAIGKAYRKDGKIIRVGGTFQDITERKRAEEKTENLAKFPSENPNPVLRVAKEGTILYANEAGMPLLDAWRTKIGKLVPDFWHKLILNALSSDLCNDSEVEYEERILSLTLAPVTNANYVNIYGLDITERKQAEERERQLQQELYLSSRLAAIGELAAGVAHEINNPLTGIMGYSELLLRKPTDENTKKGLEIIHSSSLRMAKIVQNLLTFARRHQPKKEYVDINKIVKEALELRAYELKTSDIEVALDLASDLPPIMSDFHQIQEVFLNLILNAEQAMSEAHRGGKLIIKTKQLKDRVRVSFADDGPGIPTEHLDKLFDPFFTTREEKGGTGLGLSICHGIVEEHGGRIYAKSNLGKGTTLFVELPVTT